MAHHSYLSPDGRWVLLVLMNELGKLTQCKVVAFDGAEKHTGVGPHDVACTTGAWSPDGKWMYVSTNKGGTFHIWRQRFPEGEPEQVTSGPTEEAGIAMASDGKSFITSVGTTDSTAWLHDGKTERQVSAEGDTFETALSKDGSQLYYLKRGGREMLTELWKLDIASGANESLLPGYGVDAGLDTRNYSVSADGKKIAFARRDENGVSHLWVASTDRRSSPRKLESRKTRTRHFSCREAIWCTAGRGMGGIICI